MRALALHWALEAIPGPSGSRCRRYSDTWSQIRRYILKSKGDKGIEKKGLILLWVFTLPHTDMEVYNIMHVWFEAIETKDRRLLWTPLPKINCSPGYFTLLFYLQICLHTSRLILFPCWPAIRPKRQRHKRLLTPRSPSLGKPGYN